MSQELVYTSAPKGLKPGTRGFCTVAMTQGMPPQLIERLESLSGYRQVFAPQDPQAAFNPVVQSHLRISVAGRSYHVLSRICAAGVDYSQRANKFAHHLVLDTGEIPAAGPAWALAQRGVMESAWDGATKILPAGRRCPAGNTNPAVCRAWQQATGDAGWGGILAETAIDKAKSIVTIIYRPGLDPLPLLAESLALLPPDVRRNVTFSTYYTKLPPGVECQWRCVLEGSPESKGTPGLVINLCRPLPAAQGGKFVAAARTGKLPQSAAPAPRLPTRAERPDDLELEHLLQPEDIPSPRRGGRPFVPAATGDLTLEALPPELPDDLTYSSPDSTQLPRRRPRLKQPAHWPIVVAILTVVVILVGGGFSYWLANNSSVDIAQRSDKALTEVEKHRASPKESGSSTTSNAPTNTSKNPNEDRRGSSLPTAPTDANHRPPAASSSSTPKSNTPIGEPKPPRTTSTDPPPPQKQPDPTPGVAPAAPTPPPTPPKDAGGNVRGPDQSQKATPPPFLGVDGASVDLGAFKPSIAGGEGRNDAVQLGVIQGAKPEDCKLRLIGGDKVPGMIFTVVQGSGAPTGIARWACLAQDDPSPGGTEREIGDFDIASDGHLRFRWRHGAGRFNDPTKVNLLCNCLLEIRAANRSQPAMIGLRKPVILDPIAIPADLFKTKDKDSCASPLPIKYVPESARLRVDVVFDSAMQKKWTLEPDKGNVSGCLLGVPVGPKTLKISINIEAHDGLLDFVVKYVGIDLDKNDWSDLKNVSEVLKGDGPFAVKIGPAIKHANNLTVEPADLIDKRKKLAQEEQKPEKDRDQDKIKKWKGEISALEAPKKEADQLVNVLKQLGNHTEVDFRVLCEIGDREIEVARSIEDTPRSMAGPVKKETK